MPVSADKCHGAAGAAACRSTGSNASYWPAPSFSGGTAMNRDLPTPAQILEELADRVAAQIDRQAPLAFDEALDEMTRYHRFLLSLNASRTPEGAAFSYA